MNIIKKLTLENLKKNKKRTVVTIIGVMLSTALICAVAGMVMSFRETMIELTISQTGNYHLCYQDVPQEELKYIEKNVDVERYFYSQNVGVAKLTDSKNEYKPYLNIIAMTDEALNNNGLKLIEGRMPENENEIVVSEAIETNGRVSYNVGETINVEVGKRVDANGNRLTQSNPYITEDDYEALEGFEGSQEMSLYEEQIIDTSSKQYTIVGIIKRPNSVLEPYSAPGYTVITKLTESNLNKKDEIYNVYVTVKNPKEFYKFDENIRKTIKDDTGLDIEYTKNKELLEYQGALSEETMKVLYGLAAIIIGIIIFSSVFVIRNSFSISVTEKIKEFGMLSSIGATSKQIRKSVIFEGFLIALIGIPLGIILGICAIVILVQLINLILASELSQVGAKFVYAIPLSVVGISIILGGITIFLSSLIPAIKASKISPIEAIRSNKEIKIKNKKLKTSKLTKKLFGIGGVIASKNLKRSKKKYRTTVVSLVVSIVIFISLSSFIEYGFATAQMMFKEMDYNFSAYVTTDVQKDEIVKNSLVKEYAYYVNDSIEIDVDKYGTDYTKTYFSGSGSSGENEIESAVIAFVNRDYFRKYLENNGISTDNINEIAILDDEFVYYRDNNKKTVNNFWNIKDGDSITGIIYGDDNNSKDEVTIKIASRAKADFRGYEMVYNPGGIIFVSEDYYQKDKFNTNSEGYSALYIVTDNADELERQLTDMKNKDEKFKSITINNIEEYSKQMDRIILIVSIFLYGFIIVITLIGVTNVFNTITTNMILRSKEFAMLKSIGMTKKEFNKMIRLESIMYGMKSLIIGVPLGILGSYGIYRVLADEIDFGFIWPVKAIAICVVFIFVIVAATMKYSMRQINKQNIVETIRNDNI